MFALFFCMMCVYFLKNLPGHLVSLHCWVTLLTLRICRAILNKIIRIIKKYPTTAFLYFVKMLSPEVNAAIAKKVDDYISGHNL